MDTSTGTNDKDGGDSKPLHKDKLLKINPIPGIKRRRKYGPLKTDLRSVTF